MPPKAQFFDRSGRPISAAAAHDQRGIIKDGVRMRVQFRDARQHFGDARSYWDRNKDALLVTDAIGGTEGNRPGFRVLDAPINRQAIADARAAYLNDLENAYKTPPTGAGEQGAIGQRAGDLCTINGRAGHLRMVNGTLQCVADGADAAPDEGRPHKRRVWEEPDEDDDDDADEVAESVSDDDCSPFGAGDRRTRTIDEMNVTHQRNMQRIYDQMAFELSNAWRGNK